MAKKISSITINDCIRELKGIFVNNEEFHLISQKTLADLLKLDHLVKKYCRYNHVYETSRRDQTTGREFDPKGNPQLLDALFIGCTLPETIVHLIFIMMKLKMIYLK